MEPHRQDFTAKGEPRKRKPWGQGADPILAVRMPETVIQSSRAEAEARGLTLPEFVRVALTAYVGNQRAA
jgi:hypothetical protein